MGSEETFLDRLYMVNLALAELILEDGLTFTIWEQKRMYDMHDTLSKIIEAEEKRTA